jgi:ParB family chromosome partitioning protein
MAQRRKLGAPVEMRNTSGAVGALLGREMPEVELSSTNHRAPLTKIHRKGFKRLYYDPAAIAKFGEQLKAEGGVHTPVWVRPLTGHPDEYELIAGNFRWLGSEAAGFTDLPIIVFEDIDDRTALKLTRIENDQRNDFNKADELFLFLEELSYDLVLSKEEVVKILYRLANEAKGNTNQQLLVSETARQIDAYFAGTRITRASFTSKWLPILKWPTDVMSALQSGKLSYEKLALIKGVKDPEQRQDLLNDAENFTLEALKIRIEALKQGGKPTAKEPTLKDTVVGVFRQLKGVKLEQLEPKDQKAIGKNIGQIAEILERYTESANS